MSTYFVLAVTFLLTAAAAQAQIVPTSAGSQRAANRRALREARHVDAPYKDSHLAVTRQRLRRGDSAPISPVAGEPRFDHDGQPHVTEPKYPGLRLRKRKATSVR